MQEVTLDFQEREITVFGNYESPYYEDHGDMGQEYMGSWFGIDKVEFKGRNITKLLSEDSLGDLTETCLTECND